MCSVFLIFIIVSCARMRPSEAPKDSDFHIPQQLISKFEVSDKAPPAVKLEEIKAGAVTKEKSIIVKTVKEKNKLAKAPREKKKSEKKKNADIWRSRWERPIPFFPGERTVWDITYFGAVAGTLEVKVNPFKYIKDHKVFHFRGYARTESVFSLFYRLSDTAESYMDADNIASHKFTLKLDESLQDRDVIEYYDQEAKKVFFWTKLDHKKKGKSEEQFEAAIEPFTQDALSAFFYIRTLPLENGKTYNFPVVTNGRIRSVQLKVVRRENLVTKIGELPAVVVQPEVILDGVLQKSGDTFIWLSDDEHRSILKIDAKIRVGSVIAYLRELEYGKAEPTTVAHKKP